MTSYIDVQVGMDFSADCTCGWCYRTKDWYWMDIMVRAHERGTGHRWPTPEEWDELEEMGLA